MTVRIIGAGLGRTGTQSLDLALVELLGLPCYHSREVFSRAGDAEVWLDLIDNGREPDWVQFFDGFGATLDWPAVAYWEQQAEAFPDALILLSQRATTDEWYASFSKTIVPVLLDEDRFRRPAHTVARRVIAATFTAQILDEAVVKAGYEAHNAKVRASVPSERLVEWQPADGWKPLCDALGVPVPRAPFPHTNTATEFRVGTKLESKKLPLPQRALRKVRRLLTR